MHTMVLRNLKDYTKLTHDSAVFLAEQICYDIKRFHDTSTGNVGVEEIPPTISWLDLTVDMLVRTRTDPRREENERSVSQWAKSPTTKRALKDHNITYPELMIAYRKRRDEVK